jgi:hypothetical protein
MTEENAAALAEAEGIVCHLTSLVLVDEEGASQDGIPAQRKVPTMTPRTHWLRGSILRESPMAGATAGRQAFVPPPAADEYLRETSFIRLRAQFAEQRNFDPVMRDLRSAIGIIDWSGNPEALRQGDLSELPEWVADLLRRAANLPEVEALAADLGIVPLVVAVALLARAETKNNRGAGRLQRALLRRASKSMLDAASCAAGL